MGINESKQLYDNLVRMLLDAIRNDDFEFIEKCINQHTDSMATIADKLKLFTKAYTSGSLKTFQVLVSKLDSPNKALQLSETEALIKQRIQSFTQADEHKVCDELDMVAAFLSTQLEDEIFKISKNSIEVTVHILFFKAFLRAKGVKPFDYLQYAKTTAEKTLCLELMAL
jgi:cell fate (sporulation/competence/biofilm development) regulator YmcA (YheA/YmcA/DUF963 family)